MGNASYRQTTGNQYITQDLRNYFQNDLPKFILQAKVGNGKFMKTYIMRVDSAPVVVKVYMKLNDEDLLVPAANLTIIWKTLSPAKYPNLLPYQMWIKSTSRFKSAASPVYLIRQYFSSNLYDRLSTRPFLNELEKLWILYQLFKCLEICHEHGIVHGDIKPENVMVTTSNWVILTDFSPFKPAQIPDDDPTDFQYYFDCMGRHRCYLAPERFYHRTVGSAEGSASDASSGSSNSAAPALTPGGAQASSTGTSTPAGGPSNNFKTRLRDRFNRNVSAKKFSAGSAFPASALDPAMDVFALGCLAAEVLLDGVPLLDLPGMLKYVTTTHSSTSTISSDGTTADPSSAGAVAAGVGAALGGHSNGTGTGTGNKVPLTRLDQEDSPAKSLLQRISNVHLRNVIIDMTQKDPASRLSVSEYLDVLQGKVAGLDTSTSTAGVSSDFPSPPPLSDTSRSGLPPLPPPHLAATTSPAVAVFPAYFDSSLYPLFLKMHWSGVTPDDRVNLVCQNYGELLRSIAGVDDAAGASYFASALNSAKLNTFSDARNPTVVLPADPAASFGRKPATAAAGAPTGTTARNRSSTVGADSEALGMSAGNAASSVAGNGVTPYSRERALQLAERATSRFFRPQLASQATATSSAGVADSSLQDVAELSTDELLRRSEDLLREVEALCSPTAPASNSAGVASELGSADLLVRQGMSLSRFAEEDILAHATADVSAGIVRATASKSSVSWGGVARFDASSDRPVHEGLVVLLDLLHANYRHLRYPQCKIVCLTLLVRLGRYCSDSVLLQRAVPLLLLGLEDQVASVRAMAVKSLRSVLVLIRQFSAVESNIFPLYIFPSLTRISKDLEPVVRVAFAESVGCIAETAKRFLDVAHLNALQKADHGADKDNAPTATTAANATSTANTSTATSLAASPVLGAPAVSITVDATAVPSAAAGSTNGGSTSLQFPYDVRLEQLKEQVSRWIRDLMLEHAPPVNLSASTFAASAPGAGSESKRASTIKRLLLMDILRLCTFFGQESTMDRLLTQLLTFLNDPDWELRCAFCAKIPAVCAFLGATVTAECILPCIENAIYDCEEKVVLCAVHTLVALVQLRLLSNSFVVDFVAKCKCLLLHPSQSLRDAAVEFTATAAVALGRVDAEVFIFPVVRDTLQFDIAGMPLSAELLKNALLTPLSRRAYRNALLKRLYELNHLYSAAAGGSSVVGSNGGALADSSQSIIQDSTIPDPTTAADDASKVEIIKAYLDFAAREINTKTMQWRNSAGASLGNINLQQSPALNPQSAALKNSGLPGVVATAGTTGAAAAPQSIRQSVFNLLDMTSLNISDHSIQSILVPHQKYGTFLYRPLSDDLRRQSVFFEQDGAKNSAKMRNIYGASMKAGDSVRSQIGLSQFDSSLPENGYGNDAPVAAAAAASSTQYESLGLLRKIKALDVPPLPPDTGFLVQPTPDARIYSQYTEPLDISCSLDGAARTAWRPKENVLLTTLKEHSGAVNRLAIAPDQAFFASASSDTTVKIWQTRQLDRVAFPRSAVTYRQHKGEVLDIAPVENSHSMASISSDGAVHVWRVELAAGGTVTGGPADLADEYTSSMAYSSISGAAQVRHIDPGEGAALCVNHYNSDSCSVVTYATQRGGLHGWDLRAAREAFRLNMRPELGYSTSMTISPDRNWVCLGTSKGFVSLFDIRYNTPCKLWRHSAHTSIHRLACCKAPRITSGSNSSMLPQSEGAFLFVSAGANEAAVWGIPEGGECCKCFRTVSLDASRGPIAPLPSLEEVALPRHPFAPVRFTESSPERLAAADKQDSVRALLGRISQSNMSYLVTAGTDRCIRFWDFSAPNKCFTVSGLEAAQPKAMFDSPKLNDTSVVAAPASNSSSAASGAGGKLFVCYVAATPSVDKILQMHLPVREGRGIVLPSASAKDAILDLKNIDLPMKLMLSGSREGEIKLWR